MRMHQLHESRPGNLDDVATLRGILYWARRDERSDDRARPAWVIEVDGTERPINGGDPITRAEAERLARAGDYLFDPES